MDQKKNYLPELPNEKRDPSVDKFFTLIVELRKSISEAIAGQMGGILNDLQSAFSNIAKQIETKPVQDAAAIKQAVIDGLRPLAVRMEKLQEAFPDTISINNGDIKALKAQPFEVHLTDELKKYLITINKPDPKAVVEAMKQLLNLPKDQYFNVRMTNGVKWIDKLSETIVTSFGGTNIAKDASVQAVVAKLSELLTELQGKTEPGDIQHVAGGVVVSGTVTVNQISELLDELRQKTEPSNIQPVAGNVTVSGNVAVNGTVADDATTPGAPVMIGGSAVETDGTDPTSVSAEADVARVRTDRNRRLLVNTFHPNLWTITPAAYSSAQTNTSVKGAPGANLSLYITDIFVSNGATAGIITLLDGSGGTVIFRAYTAINGGAVLNLMTPIRLTPNTALCITSTTVTTHSVTISGFTAP